MNTQTVWLNVYRSGYYHRAGKPTATNLHGGDLYVSYADATAAIQHDRGYITTVSFQMPVPADTHIYRNPENSVPRERGGEDRVLPTFVPSGTRVPNGAAYA
jgi:hypothetical protein